MRDATGLFLVVIVLAVIATIVVWSLAQAQRQSRTLERIAQRFRGKLEAGSLFARAQVRLRFQGYPALLKYVRHGEHGAHTTFSITWPEPRFRLEVYPQDILAGFRRLWGMEDIEIGSPEFDRSFFISGNSPSAVCDMLSAEVQALIWKLAQVGSLPGIHGTCDIQVKFLGGVLTITKPRHLTSYDQLEELVTLSAQLFEAATRTRATGITFVGTSPTSEPQEPDTLESQCQVCGEPLAADLVWCAACKTPHHRECWEYFGGCSTYACGHKKCKRKTLRTKN